MRERCDETGLGAMREGGDDDDGDDGDDEDDETNLLSAHPRAEKAP